MTQKILHASGTVATDGDSAVSIVGSGSVLADSTDTTYVQGTVAGPLEYTSALDVLAGYESGDAITLHVRLSLDSPGTPIDAYARVFVSTGAAPVTVSDEVGGFSDGNLFGLGFALTDVSGTIVDYTAPLAMGAWSPNTEADVVAALEAGAFLEVNAIFNNNGFPTTSRVYDAYITVGEDTEPTEIELPCDEWVNLDLSTAVFLTAPDSGSDPGPFGQYSDGVIWPEPDPGGGADYYPDYTLGVILDASKPVRGSVTFDPTSEHDSGGRTITILGTNLTDGTIPVGPPTFYDDETNTADVVSFTIGPGIGDWDDPTNGVAAGWTGLWFETDNAGAVSQISIMKVCTDDGPTPPVDGAGDDGPNPGADNGDPSPPLAPGDAPNVPPGVGLLTPSNRRGAPTKTQVVVGGTWLPTVAQVGDLTWSHTWPGGSANASWTATGTPKPLTRRGLLVQLMFGGQCIWSGPQTDEGNAVGLWTVGVDYAALDGSGDATTVPDDAIDAAIARGMPWKRRDSISDTAVDLDISEGPTTIGDLLDAYAEAATKRWAVDPDGYVAAFNDPTVPAAVILPLDAPLEPSGEDLATALIGRYFNGSTYATTTVVTDAEAVIANGYHEATIDLTGRGTLTSTKAVNLLKSILALGRSKPAWSSSITLNHGDLLSLGGVPMGLEMFTAGQKVRIVGLAADSQLLGGNYVDVLVGESGVDDGLTLTPIGAPSRSLVDLLAQAARKKGA